MAYTEKCKTCVHEYGNSFTGVCRGCCFCDKYEEKSKEDDFETKFDIMRKKLKEWAYGTPLILTTSKCNEDGGLLTPFCRRFTFVNYRTNKKETFIVNFMQMESTGIAEAMVRIKERVTRSLLDTEYKGGFVYRTTKNPYMYTARFQQEPVIRQDGFTAKGFVDEMHLNKHDDRLDAMRQIRYDNARLAKQVADEQNYEFIRRLLSINKEENMRTIYKRLDIKDVIFNGPATIVIWNDNTKTVVKAQDGEKVDYEKGLAMAISKKALGNQGNYYDQFSKWLKKAPVVKKTTRKTVKKDK